MTYTAVVASVPGGLTQGLLGILIDTASAGPAAADLDKEKSASLRPTD